MEADKTANTVEILAEPEETKPTDTEVVTRASLKEKGWSKAEMDNAEKRGMIPTAEEKPAKEPAKVLPEAGKEPGKEPEKKPDLPSNFLDDMDKELTPAQEKVFLETFPPGTKPRAFYFRAKNERSQRQRVEAERDKLALELQLRKDNESKADPAVEVERDANGNVIDPEDRPLTLKQLRALQKAEMEEANRRRDELSSRSNKVADALKEQEEFAKSTIPDFDETVKLATDLVKNIDSIAEPTRKSKAFKLLRDLQTAATQADKYGVDDYNASMIAYELGQMHPDYGQKKEEKPDNGADPKANGGLTPEQMKRIEENTQRRASSASLPGSSGGRRVISVEDVTVKDVLKMSPEQRYKFKKDHPEKMAKLMRG